MSSDHKDRAMGQETLPRVVLGTTNANMAFFWEDSLPYHEAVMGGRQEKNLKPTNNSKEVAESPAAVKPASPQVMLEGGKNLHCCICAQTSVQSVSLITMSGNQRLFCERTQWNRVLPYPLLLLMTSMGMMYVWWSAKRTLLAMGMGRAFGESHCRRAAHSLQFAPTEKLGIFSRKETVPRDVPKWLPISKNKFDHITLKGNKMAPGNWICLILSHLAHTALCASEKKLF